MTAEVSRNVFPVAPNLQQAATSIVSSAEAQAPQSIDVALKSFEWVSREQRIAPRTTKIAEGASMDSPSRYLATARLNGSNFDGLVRTDDLLACLRSSNLNFQKGVAAFLKSGIQEALAGLKNLPEPGIREPQMAPALDVLLTPEKLKNPDRAALQVSIQAVNDMFSALRNMKSVNTEMQANMLRSLRA